MDQILKEIRAELKNLADPEFQVTSKRFFKETITCYGVRTPQVMKVARKYWKVVSAREKHEIFSLCEELYRSGYIEESFIVSEWAYLLRNRYEHEDFPVFRRWIESYITNWASCDGFCNHAMGAFIEQFPEYINDLKSWTQSRNRWMRRASAVSLIIPAKHGMFLKEAMAIADLLLTDDDEMVQKGYGWLLKEASRKHAGEIFSYVMKNKQQMPRTALRYAIELMPKDLKAQAMKKEW